MAKRTLAHAATLLPMAIGLAMTARPTASPTTTSVDVKSTARTRASGAHARGGGGQPFKTTCTLPFDGVDNPDIDSRCPVDGGSLSPAKQAQSRAKNNLCAATGSPQKITYQEFKDKQDNVNTKVNLANLSVDRRELTALGEGTFVEYIAFIQDAHYSDVSSGEAVNCNIPGDSTNDIHIVLVQDPNDDPCTSTTAEMIPHFRPEAWTDKNVDSVKEHPVRVRGPLFYDDAHKPCSGTSRPSPNRASVWEIHPVYSMDVCRMDDLKQCQSSTNAADWKSLEDWLTNPD
jgi:hypothetical protein